MYNGDLIHFSNEDNLKEVGTKYIMKYITLYDLNFQYEYRP